MSNLPPDVISEDLLQRVCAEFIQLPRLQLTWPQAQRLWGLDESTCAQILERLVETKTPWIDPRGNTYTLLTSGRGPEPRTGRVTAHDVRPRVWGEVV